MMNFSNKISKVNIAVKIKMYVIKKYYNVNTCQSIRTERILFFFDIS